MQRLRSALAAARAQLTHWLDAGRLRHAPWAGAVEALVQIRSSAGRGRLWTRLRHGPQLHQITEYTERDRYPGLFDRVRELRPGAERILSFGCSTGEEIESIRRRFPDSTIVGLEIHGRSREIARRRFARDAKVQVRAGCARHERFDIIFAMAVLQYKPQWVERHDVENLAPFYPFSKFEAEILRMSDRLAPGGLLCVVHAHYRVEDTRAATRLLPLKTSLRHDRLFRPDGSRYRTDPATSSIFIVAADAMPRQNADQPHRPSENGHESVDQALPPG